jgi:tetratricopeptide (TPR) repeat protein
MDAYEARGELLFQSEQYELAIRDFEYLAIFNEKEDYSEKRAICHEKLGNYTKCLQLYLAQSH